MMSHLSADAQLEGESSTSNKDALTTAVPDMAEIIPLATELSNRLAMLESSIRDGFDVSEVEDKCAAIESNLEEPVSQLQRLKESEQFKYGKLVELRDRIKREDELFDKINKPLGQAISQLDGWRKQWLAEKKNWEQLQAPLLEDGQLDQLESTLEKAHETIDTALSLITAQLDAMLTLQAKVSSTHAEIAALVTELDGLIVAERRSVLFDASPPMFSLEFYSQFSGALLYEMQRGLEDISWPSDRFYAQQGWIILVQAIISLFVIIAIRRNRQVLAASPQWRFLASRPISAGLFFGYMAAGLIFEYAGAPAVCKLADMAVGGMALARLSAGLTESSWKKQLVYGLIIVLIVTSLMELLSFPLPLFRLYRVLVCVIGLLLCLRWGRQSIRNEDPAFWRWLLRSATFFFAAILIAELWGKNAMASYLFMSLIDTIATALVFILFIYIIRGVFEWLFRHSPLRRAAVLYQDDTDVIIRRLAFFVDAVVVGLVLLPAILTTWGVYDSLGAATKGLLELGLVIGSDRITVGLVLVSALLLCGSFLVSWVLQKLLMDEMFMKQKVERGVRHAIGRLVHYGIILVGFTLAISALGVEITKITIVLSALGVGIGFGLQGIVNNFVSGLILLFERPVRVGDSIEIGDKWAEIRRIGLRSTTVKTFDEADVIIPNADLTSNQVTNWTLTNRLVRLIIPVGVAYGSDVPLVLETLAACAKDHKMVAAFPATQTLFLSFGESSLDFELRVWITDADHRLKVRSELHQEIDRRFREAGIVIAFPQRDLHLRTMDESVILHTSETSR
jgi:small-conductance mechanosensitive channel